MIIKTFIKKKSFFIYLLFLTLISFSINQYYAYIGVLPVDSFSTFNAGYDILNGSIPFKDFWSIKGPVMDVLQAFFFKFFGVSWFSYAMHSSFFNSIFALSTFFTLKKFNLEIKYCFFLFSFSFNTYVPNLWDTFYRSFHCHFLHVVNLLFMFSY